MREILGLTHQIEYAILSGDEGLILRLNQSIRETEYTLSGLKTHRQSLINQLCTYFQCTRGLNDDLVQLLQSYDEFEQEGPILFEQLELIEAKIQDQTLRNQGLIQAIDTDQSLPEYHDDHALAFYSVPSKSKTNPLRVTVEFPDNDLPE